VRVGANGDRGDALHRGDVDRRDRVVLPVCRVGRFAVWRENDVRGLLAGRHGAVKLEGGRVAHQRQRCVTTDCPDALAVRRNLKAEQNRIDVDCEHVTGLHFSDHKADISECNNEWEVL
jgi:hypothetical protein